MRLVRDNIPNAETDNGNLVGLYLSELSHQSGELIEAVIADGRAVHMAMSIVDMLAVLRGLAKQLGIAEAELTQLSMAQNVQLGEYSNRVADA